MVWAIVFFLKFPPEKRQEQNKSLRNNTKLDEGLANGLIVLGGQPEIDLNINIYKSNYGKKEITNVLHEDDQRTKGNRRDCQLGAKSFPVEGGNTGVSSWYLE